MTIAELYGKIEPYEHREDLLTSDVFGTFKYLGIEYGLRQFLIRAINLKKENLKIPSDFKEVEIHFWPKMIDGTEPDVLIELFNDGSESIIVMVEAKYFSSKNIEEEDVQEENGEIRKEIFDQLETHFKNLQELSFKEIKVKKGRVLEKILLYVTSDYSMPKEEIIESLELIEGKYKNPKDKLFWLSWREVPTIIKKYRNSWRSELGYPIFYLIEDLENLLIRKNLRRFEGFRTLPELDIQQPVESIFYEKFGGFKFIGEYNFNFDESNIFWTEK